MALTGKNGEPTSICRGDEIVFLPAYHTVFFLKGGNPRNRIKVAGHDSFSLWFLRNAEDFRVFAEVISEVIGLEITPRSARNEEGDALIYRFV